MFPILAMDIHVSIVNFTINVTVKMVIQVLTVKFLLMFVRIYHAKMVGCVRMLMDTTTVPV